MLCRGDVPETVWGEAETDRETGEKQEYVFADAAGESPPLHLCDSPPPLVSSSLCRESPVSVSEEASGENGMLCDVSVNMHSDLHLTQRAEINFHSEEMLR